MKNYIVTAINDDTLVSVAAQELRRYLYVLGFGLADLVHEIPEEGKCMILGTADSPVLAAYAGRIDCSGLDGDGYIITSFDERGIVFAGKTGIAVLYSVYRYLERLGIGFYLHGDTLPDEMPKIDIWSLRKDIMETPSFKVRGIHPFHDFPEGPDWWNVDDYYAVITQLPKMRANFFALHTYPENPKAPEAMTAEPLVWIGRKEDCGEDGEVKVSYPVQHFKTNGNSWGYHPTKTSAYLCGAGNVFEKDAFGADYMEGYEEEIYCRELHEADVPPDKYNRMFNRYGELLAETFTYAGSLSVKTCIGTEAPLTIPKALKEYLNIEGEADRETVKELYEGIFERIKRLHPLDYYWMWTPEDWTWLGNSPEQTERTIRDFSCALEAKEKTKAPFELAVCGWTLGPQEDRARFDTCLPKSMPFSCINRNVGFDPLEPKFQDLDGRDAWAIPWLEDDPAMISPQLWAGRMRRDAFDAGRYGCQGLLGIHWRTRSIAPNIKALMEAAWEQPWAAQLPEEISLEGYIGKDSYTEQYENLSGIQGSARKNVDGYLLKMPAGNYTVKLYFTPEKALVDIRVKDLCLTGISLDEKEHEVSVSGIEVEQDTWLKIAFKVREGQFGLTAICLEGATKNNQLDGNDYSRKINCGGPCLEAYEADLAMYREHGRYAPVKDFYLEFAAKEFGEKAGREAAEILAEQDGYLPRPSRWEDGPGNIYCNKIPWREIEAQYRFADEFSKLDALVEGRGNRNRFAYWKHAFLAMKETAHLGCLWGEFEQTVTGSVEDGRALSAVYQEIVDVIEKLNRHLLLGLETHGDMGVLTNIQQRSIMPILRYCREHLEKAGAAVSEPADSVVNPCSKLVVPTVRTSLKKGEDFRIKVIVIGGCETAPVLYRKALEASEYEQSTFQKKERWVYELTIPGDKLQGDFEYHIRLQENDTSLCFPCSTLHEDQTVILLEQ